MTTIQDVIGNYTPLSNNIVQKIGIIRGGIACKVFFTSNLSDRICRMGLTRMAKELGISPSTASKNLKWLVAKDYIEQVQAHTATEPAHYRCTQKFYDTAKGIDLINTPIDLINTPIDLINQEEESKEDIEETTTSSDDFSIITKTYENEIGLLSPVIADKIKDCTGDYPTDWIVEAIGIAANQNKRRWAYVEGILRKWKTEGRDCKANGKPKKEREKMLDPITGEWTGGYYS